MWNVSRVTGMSHIFVVTNLNGNTGIPKWDMSRVTDMSHMFWDARLFNGDISKWDVSNVTDMNSLFLYWNCLTVISRVGTCRVCRHELGARLFQSNVSTWDGSRVADMNIMFASAT